MTLPAALEPFRHFTQFITYKLEPKENELGDLVSLSCNDSMGTCISDPDILALKANPVDSQSHSMNFANHRAVFKAFPPVDFKSTASADSATAPMMSLLAKVP